MGDTIHWLLAICPAQCVPAFPRNVIMLPDSHAGPVWCYFGHTIITFSCSWLGFTFISLRDDDWSQMWSIWIAFGSGQLIGCDRVIWPCEWALGFCWKSVMLAGYWHPICWCSKSTSFRWLATDLCPLIRTTRNTSVRRNQSCTT